MNLLWHISLSSWTRLFQLSCNLTKLFFEIFRALTSYYIFFLVNEWDLSNRCISSTITIFVADFGWMYVSTYPSSKRIDLISTIRWRYHDVLFRFSSSTYFRYYWTIGFRRRKMMGIIAYSSYDDTTRTFDYSIAPHESYGYTYDFHTQGIERRYFFWDL